MYAYPDTITAIGYGKTLAGLVTSGQAVAQKSLTAKCVFVIEGVALDKVLGDPETAGRFSASEDSEEDIAASEQCIDAMTLLIEQHGHAVPARIACATGDRKKVDWARLFQLAKTLAPIILLFV